MSGVLRTARKNLPYDLANEEDEAILKENEVDFTPILLKTMDPWDRWIYKIFGENPGQDALLLEMKKERL